jgi:hypothetical protein
MRSRLTRAVVPVIGLLAVTGALALVATAPVVLFSPSNEAGARPAAPAASSEVARVTAPSFHPQRPGSQTAASETPEAPAGPSAGGQPAASSPAASSPAGEAGGATAGKAARRPAGEGSGPAAGEETEPEHSGKAKGKCKDKGKDEAKDHGEQKHHGKAKGHGKPKHHGKAKGHSKWQGRSVVAFAPRGAKPDHVGPSRAGKHASRGARPHSRARR